MKATTILDFTIALMMIADAVIILLYIIGVDLI